MFYIILQYWNNGSLTSSFYCLACVIACNIYTNTDKFKQSSHNVVLYIALYPYTCCDKSMDNAGDTM